MGHIKGPWGQGHGPGHGPDHGAGAMGRATALYCNQTDFTATKQTLLQPKATLLQPGYEAEGPNSLKKRVWATRNDMEKLVFHVEFQSQDGCSKVRLRRRMHFSALCK